MVKFPECIARHDPSMAIDASKELGQHNDTSVEMPSQMLSQQSLTVIVNAHLGRPFLLVSRPWPAPFLFERMSPTWSRASKCLAPSAVSPDQEAPKVEIPLQRWLGQQHDCPLSLWKTSQSMHVKPLQVF